MKNKIFILTYQNYVENDTISTVFSTLKKAKDYLDLELSKEEMSYDNFNYKINDYTSTPHIFEEDLKYDFDGVDWSYIIEESIIDP